jgi:hypothetical protein
MKYFIISYRCTNNDASKTFYGDANISCKVFPPRKVICDKILYGEFTSLVILGITKISKKDYLSFRDKGSNDE